MNFLSPIHHKPETLLDDRYKNNPKSKAVNTHSVPHSARRRPIINQEAKKTPAQAHRHRPRAPCLTCSNSSSAKPRSLFSTISAASGLGGVVNQISSVPNKISGAASNTYDGLLGGLDSASNSLEKYSNSGAANIPLPTLRVLTLSCIAVLVVLF